MKDTDNQSRKRPEVKVVHHSYQPSKAELEAGVSIPTTPERLARAVVAGGARRKPKCGPS